MNLTTIAVPGGDLLIDADEWTSHALIAQHGWERELGGLCEAAIRPGQTVLDVGAHVGMYTLRFASLVGAGGRVHAFEPMPDNVALLRRNVDANGYGARVEVVASAVADAPGGRPMFRYAGDRYPGSSSMLYSLVGGHGYVTAGEVTVDTIDRYADAHGLLAIDFMKIDTEGAELRVLRGARRVIERSRGVTVLVELHRAELAADRSSVEDVVALLEAMGLTVHQLEAEGESARARPRRADEPIVGHVLLAR